MKAFACVSACRIGRATIALDYVDIDRHSDRHQIEFWLVTLVRICRRVTDSRLAPSRLKMRHLRDGLPAEFRAFSWLRCRVRRR